MVKNNSPENNEGQYITDRLGLAGKPDTDVDWHEIEQFDGGTPMDLHFSSLYDEPEDQSGEKTDLATGEPYDNETTAGEGIGVISAREAAKVLEVESEQEEVDVNLLAKAERDKLRYEEILDKDAEQLTEADIKFLNRYLEKLQELKRSGRRHPSSHRPQ